jgi:hypothetical protein
LVMSDNIEVKVDMLFEIDITEVSPEFRNADGLEEIVTEVLDSCIYDIPGSELKRIGIEIKGLD